MRRVDYPALPLPQAAATFNSVAYISSLNSDAAIVLGAGTWLRMDLADGLVTGPTAQASARRAANSHVHHAIYVQAVRWAVGTDDGRVSLATYGLVPDLVHVGTSLVRSVGRRLTLRRGLANSIGLEKAAGLSVYDGVSGRLNARLALGFAPRDVLLLQLLPGSLAALVVYTGDREQPLRRVLIDTGGLEVVSNVAIASDPLRRLKFTRLGGPRVLLSSNGQHISLSTKATGRTVVYDVEGRGTASNVPGTLVGWSPIEPTVAVCDGRILTLLRADARSEITVDLPEPATTRPVFSPDGTRLAVATSERVLLIQPSVA